ncbi:MAG: beta-galactosidase, partial [Anaerolineales bacterium]|nr:beta-galactosidase [Anaerolineales bacterium]
MPTAEGFADKATTALGEEPRQAASATGNLPPLPTVMHILWSDVASSQRAAELKAMGFDGVFKCVAYRPNYPAPPIHAAGEWRLVESVEGQYDWTDLRRCLDAALQANMWIIPEIVINIPPDWFVDRYPDSILRDNRGEIVPANVDAPYLLSPWFVASGDADADLIPFISSFLALVSDYPNVAGIMVGNFLLNNLPWRLGSGPDFTYWPVFDAYALADYQGQFGTQPPATWANYLAMSPSAQSAFRGWLIAAISDN